MGIGIVKLSSYTAYLSLDYLNQENVFIFVMFERFVRTYYKTRYLTNSGLDFGLNYFYLTMFFVCRRNCGLIT